MIKASCSFWLCRKRKLGFCRNWNETGQYQFRPKTKMDQTGQSASASAENEIRSVSSKYIWDYSPSFLLCVYRTLCDLSNGHNTVSNWAVTDLHSFLVISTATVRHTRLGLHHHFVYSSRVQKQMHNLKSSSSVILVEYTPSFKLRLLVDWFYWVLRVHLSEYRKCAFVLVVVINNTVACMLREAQWVKNI